MSFFEEVQQELEAEKEFAQPSNNSSWFKIQEGLNQIRILTRPVIFYEKFKTGICYHECNYQGTPKFLAWVVDRMDKTAENPDGTIKLMRLPYSFIKDIGAFEKDSDYAFDGFPLPYDVKIEAKGAGTKEVVYTLYPAPNRALEGQILSQTGSLKSCSEIIATMQDNQKKKDLESGLFEKRKAEADGRKEEIRKMKEEAKNSPTEPTIQYPEDEVNPDDIPF